MAILLAIADLSGALFIAYAMWSGANDCLKREELHREPWQKFAKGLAWAGAFCVAHWIAALILRHSHPALADSLLYGLATCEFGIGAVLKSAGCM